MRFWWVNHKQTYVHEIENGFHWSPITNRDGKRNQSYVNMTLIEPGDLILSYANGIIQEVGLIIKGATKSPRPPVFAEAGEQWNLEGWLVDVDWTHLDEPIIPKEHMDIIVPLLPEKYSPIQTNGRGNQIIYLAAISPELFHTLIQFTDITQIDEQINSKEEDGQVDVISHMDIPETTKEQLIKARRGQGLFREILVSIENQCRVTGVSDKRFLIASHIKPWKDSTNIERLDGNNGLLLSPHVDRLFDQGYLSFSDAGEILCVDETISNVLEVWGIEPNINVGQFNPQQQAYLLYHRNNVFRKKTRVD